MALLQGFLSGLALVILIGPVLFVLLRATLEYGKLPGFLVAIGIFVSDLVAVTLCYWTAGGFFDDPVHQKWLAFGGAALLIGFGVKYVLDPSMKDNQELKLTRGQYLGFFIKGFLINFVNPFVFIVWLGYIGIAETKFELSGIEILIFLFGACLAIILLDSLKVIFAHRIRPWLNPKILKIIFRVSGVLLIGFGLRLVYVGFTGV